MDGDSGPADRLILDTLLPLAHRGLADYPVEPAEVDRYLGSSRSV